MATLKLEKKGSRQKIEIVTDTNDDWFLHVKYLAKKDNSLLHSSMIIRKDLDTRLLYLASMGWILKE
jgi:hypothetical protein